MDRIHYPLRCRVIFPPGPPLSKNVEAIGYLPLEERPAFKMALHRAGGRWYWYCAHLWTSGWSIVEVTDPEKPRFVRFIDESGEIRTIREKAEPLSEAIIDSRGPVAYVLELNAGTVRSIGIRTGDRVESPVISGGAEQP